MALVGYGTGVQKALEAADLLAEGGIDVTVADARFAKPIDAELIASWRPSTSCWSPSRRACSPAASARRCGRPATTPAVPLPRILRVGLPDRYVTHGKPALLHAEVGFTGKAIAQRIEAAVAAGSGALARRLRRAPPSAPGARSIRDRQDGRSRRVPRARRP